MSADGAPAPRRPIPGPPRRVLVVDDDPTVRAAVARLLRHDEFAVTTVEGAAEAIEALANEAFDVVLIDLELPGMHGLELLAAVRGGHPDLECVLFTGHGDIATGFKVLEAGAADYVEKPIRDRARLVQVLRRAADVHRLRLEAERLTRRVALLDAPAGSTPPPAPARRAAPPASDADPFAAYLALAYPEAKQRLIDDFTRRYVDTKLEAHGGNMTRAAAASGLLRPNFGRLIRQLATKDAPDDP